MKQTLKYTLLVVPLVGVAVAGFAIGRSSAPVTTTGTIIEIEAPVVNNGTGDKVAKIELLTKKLSDAETKIQELNSEIDKLLGKDLPAIEEVAENKEPQNENWRSTRKPGETREQEMERLKTENPEQYAARLKAQEERQKRHQEFIEKRKNSEAERDDFFANVNIAYMSPKEQKDLATFVGEYHELRGLIDQSTTGEAPDRARLFQLGMTVMQKSTEIRATLLKATAKEMGFNESESREFSSSINEIFGATSLMGPGGSGMIDMMRRGGGRGGWGR